MFAKNSRQPDKKSPTPPISRFRAVSRRARLAILYFMERVFLIIGAILGFFAVAAGAFGAHALRGRLSAEMLDIFEVAVRYQMYHALALVALGWVTVRAPTPTLNLSGWLMVGGTVVFSGTLYILALTGIRWLGAITPLGGLALMAGWACLTWGAWTATIGR